LLEDYLDVLTVDDVCGILRLSRRSVMRLIKSGEIRARKIGRVYRISKYAVVDYLNAKAI